MNTEKYLQPNIEENLYITRKDIIQIFRKICGELEVEILEAEAIHMLRKLTDYYIKIIFYGICRKRLMQFLIEIFDFLAVNMID